jgi:transcriptional regulator with XRE-family HTH domain
VRERNSDPFDIEVGRRIRAQRLVRGLSQTDLGKAIGVTFKKIAKYERGADSVAAGRLTQIAQFLKVPVGFFFGRHDYVESVVAPPVSPDLDPLALRLLRAFAALVDEELRRSIVEQVEQTAQSASSSAP